MFTSTEALTQITFLAAFSFCHPKQFPTNRFQNTKTQKTYASTKIWAANQLPFDTSLFQSAPLLELAKRPSITIPHFISILRRFLPQRTDARHIRTACKHPNSHSHCYWCGHCSRSIGSNNPIPDDFKGYVYSQSKLKHSRRHCACPSMDTKLRGHCCRV